MKAVVISCLLLFLWLIGFSQPADGFNHIKMERILENLELKSHSTENETHRSCTDRYRNTDGSPFLTDDWMKGTLRTSNDEHQIEVLIHYDLFTHDLFGLKDNEEIVLNKRRITEFELIENGQTRRFAKVDPIRTNGFCEILFEDNELFFFKKVQVRRTSERKMGMINLEPKFLRMNQYYLKFKRNSKGCHLLNLKKKDAFDLLPAYRVNSAKDFLKSSGIKLKSLESYIQMFEATREKSIWESNVRRI